MSSMVNALLVERQGSMALSSFSIGRKCTVGCSKDFGVAGGCGKVQHVGHIPRNKSLVCAALVEECFASNSLLIAVEEGDDSDGMQILRGDLSTISINLPRGAWLLHADLSLALQSLSKRTIGESSAIC